MPTRKPKSKQVVDVTIRLDSETFQKLIEKYDNVEELLRLAAEQLALADEKNLAQILKLEHQYELANLFYQTLQDFVYTLRWVRSLEPTLLNIPEFYEYVINTVTLKWQLLMKMRKLLKSLRLPPIYKRKMELLLQALESHTTTSMQPEETGGDYAYP